MSATRMVGVVEAEAGVMARPPVQTTIGTYPGVRDVHGQWWIVGPQGCEPVEVSDGEVGSVDAAGDLGGGAVESGGGVGERGIG